MPSEQTRRALAFVDTELDDAGCRNVCQRGVQQLQQCVRAVVVQSPIVQVSEGASGCSVEHGTLNSAPTKVDHLLAEQNGSFHVLRKDHCCVFQRLQARTKFDLAGGYSGHWHGQRLWQCLRNQHGCRSVQSRYDRTRPVRPMSSNSQPVREVAPSRGPNPQRIGAHGHICDAFYGISHEQTPARRLCSAVQPRSEHDLGQVAHQRPGLPHDQRGLHVRPEAAPPPASLAGQGLRGCRDEAALERIPTILLVVGRNADRNKQRGPLRRHRLDHRDHVGGQRAGAHVDTDVA
mmetsp:Transcript_122674/g.392766  ORF Transcript_122674/g.392766 Transcript_122674/m.392766 type:complete len:291 (-) Transcript_122674:16-888(-)